jgi:hypothetical protein
MVALLHGRVRVDRRRSLPGSERRMSPYRTPLRRPEPEHHFARTVRWPDWAFVVVAAWAAAVVVLIAN